jgi:hypothetical protein
LDDGANEATIVWLGNITGYHWPMEHVKETWSVRPLSNGWILPRALPSSAVIRQFAHVFFIFYPLPKAWRASGGWHLGRISSQKEEFSHFQPHF